MNLATSPLENDTHSLTTLSSACLLSLMVAMGNTGKLLTGISALLMIVGQRPTQALQVMYTHILRENIKEIFFNNDGVYVGVFFYGGGVRAG